MDFVSFFEVHPNILIHMVYEPLLEVLEKVLVLSSTPVCLHYDTIFNVGDFYLSTLAFRHTLFLVIPFAFCALCKFHSEHLSFFRSIHKRLPLLSTKTFIIVTDQEF